MPNRLPQPLGPWLFREDPADQGVEERWYSPRADTAGWLEIAVPAFWAETHVGDYIGYGWYRTTFQLPESWKGRSVRLLFSGVDEQAWVYVNGRLAGEHSAGSEDVPIGQLWDVPFTIEVKPEHLHTGKSNVLTVRVHNNKANGGIWRPVLAHALNAKHHRDDEH